MSILLIKLLLLQVMINTNIFALAYSQTSNTCVNRDYYSRIVANIRNRLYPYTDSP